ncbi:MAG TPA: hypothetical protein VNO43_07395 [Candidatus Eisenbacteria bacterium]|nr:hypothetical protein [Candidatus Eisenbacteria bacterium]
MHTFLKGITHGIAAVLLTASVASAATEDLSIEQDADLLPGRTEITVTVNVQCTLNDNATLTVYVFQNHGRLLNIGIGSHSFVCGGGLETFPVQVLAVPGLNFQPGPATAVVRSATGAGASIDATRDEGSRIKLK